VLTSPAYLRDVAAAAAAAGPAVAVGPLALGYLQRVALGGSNDDRVAPASGFGTHAHQDMEIVTWVLSGRLSHRDSEGNEVDLLIPVGAQLHAIEIKAGATVNPDYFKGLKTFAAHHPSVHASGCVVFGGDHGQNRSDWPVHTWHQLAIQPAS
jgi:hypothetical protein